MLGAYQFSGKNTSPKPCNPGIWHYSTVDRKAHSFANLTSGRLYEKEILMLGIDSDNGYSPCLFPAQI
jgi:hypothetical protein